MSTLLSMVRLGSCDRRGGGPGGGLLVVGVGQGWRAGLVRQVPGEPGAVGQDRAGHVAGHHADDGGVDDSDPARPRRAGDRAERPAVQLAGGTERAAGGGDDTAGPGRHVGEHTGRGGQRHRGRVDPRRQLVDQRGVVEVDVGREVGRDGIGHGPSHRRVVRVDRLGDRAARHGDRRERGADVAGALVGVGAVHRRARLGDGVGVRRSAGRGRVDVRDVGQHRPRVDAGRGAGGRCAPGQVAHGPDDRGPAGRAALGARGAEAGGRLAQRSRVHGEPGGHAVDEAGLEQRRADHGRVRGVDVACGHGVGDRLAGDGVGGARYLGRGRDRLDDGHPRGRGLRGVRGVELGAGAQPRCW